MEFKTETDHAKSRLAIFEQLPTKGKRLKRKLNTNDELHNTESQLSECDLVIDDDYGLPKRKRGYVTREKTKVSMTCKWADCSTAPFPNYDNYMRHVQTHPKTDDLKCLWQDCSYTTTDSNFVLKHVTFHGHLEHLQEIGKSVVQTFSLPPCHQELTYSIPDHTKDFICGWKGCEVALNTFYDFQCHVALHVDRNPLKAPEGEKILCLWQTCTASYTERCKLKRHLFTHTKEKVVACPTCYGTFSSNNKLEEHRKRQLPTQMLSFQCSQCSKLFGSERLLRDHMISHINHYKCSLCEMTCCRPSILLKHMKYRHFNERPFKCHLCKHASVTQNDLQQHLVTHCAEKLMACTECDFRCRTFTTLDNHYTKVHNHEWRCTFECHCCAEKFSEGKKLTSHLMEQHDYYWPAGHSKFRYKEDPDGIYRLQTVRYESLEVTKEMISKKVPQISENVKVDLEHEGVDEGTHKYKLVLKEGNGEEEEKVVEEEEEEKKKIGQPSVKVELEHVQEKRLLVKEDGHGSNFALILSGSGQQNVVCQTKKEIEIVIEDVDEEGNVVKSEKVTSNEMVFVPPRG